MKRARVCESCRREPAEFTVSLTSKSGRREEQDLCGVCTGDRERVLFGDGGLLLTELLQAERFSGDREQNRTKVCPHCGNTVNRIEEAGEVGCSMCYMVFRDEVAKVIKELHGHRG